MFLAADVQPGRGPTDDFWYMPVGLPSAAGVRVSPDTALSLSVLYACCLVLGQDVGMTPCLLYQRLAPRGKKRAADHQLYRLIHRRPNRWQTAFQWFQMMQWHLVLRYNAYSEKLFDGMGRVAELIPLHPDRVLVERFMQGTVERFRYRVKDRGGNERVLLRDEMLHIRGLTSDGIEGFSPLDAQKDSIGEAIAAQQYSSRRMRNDARPGGVLEWEGHFKDDEDRRKFRASWQEAQAGANHGKTAVLERGMTWKDLGVKNTELQFIELREMKGYEIAAAHRMQPHKVGLLKRATFSNITDQNIEHLTDTLMPWFRNWEQELSVQLLTEEEQEEYFFEFMTAAWLRGDPKSRAEYFSKRFATGSMSPNDIRELDNENPVDGGDRYFVPVNMVPMDRVDDTLDKPASASPEQPGQEQTERERELEEGNAARVVRKEVARLRWLQGRDGFFEESAAFYAEHVDFVAEVMRVGRDVAGDYCARRLSALEASRLQVMTWIADLESKGAGELLEMVRAARA